MLFNLRVYFYLFRKILILRRNTLDKIVIWRVSGSMNENAKVFNDIAQILHDILSCYVPEVLISDFPHPNADITIALNSFSLCGYRGPKPINLLIYNFEQLSLTADQTADRYVKILKMHSVMEYSEMNQSVLDFYKINYSLVPPLYHKYLEYESVNNLPSSSRVDVVFIGSLDARRKLLEEMLASNGIKVSFAESVYDNERNLIYQQSTLSIYAFAYKTAVIPWLRFSFLLANRIPILCEESPNGDSHEALSSFIYFAKFDDLPKVACMLLSNPAKLHEMRELGYKYIRSRPVDPYVLRAISNVMPFQKNCS